jgi:hypothetical protein
MEWSKARALDLLKAAAFLDTGFSRNQRKTTSVIWASDPE